MALDPKKIPSSVAMKQNEFTEGLFNRPPRVLSQSLALSPSKNVLSEARKRVDILKSMQGCSKCRARLENPHADYHLTAVIDEDKI